MASVTVRRDDLYEVLGVARSASSDDIALAFRTHAKRLHPDRNPGDASAADRFKELTLAYQTLIRPRSRAAYDARHGPSQPATPTASEVHQPLFRTPGRARAAVWSGYALFLVGLVGACVLAIVNTGDVGETVTLWFAVAKLLVCGPALTVAGYVRLRAFATER